MRVITMNIDMKCVDRVREREQEEIEAINEDNSRLRKLIEDTNIANQAVIQNL